eukprot:6193561-Pleurochrysis_carterae.AAC.4
MEVCSSYLPPLWSAALNVYRHLQEESSGFSLLTANQRQQAHSLRFVRSQHAHVPLRVSADMRSLRPASSNAPASWAAARFAEEASAPAAWTPASALALFHCAYTRGHRRMSTGHKKYTGMYWRAWRGCIHDLAEPGERFEHCQQASIFLY